MKAYKEETKRDFKPFRLIIDVENEDELKELWCRFNASIESIKNCNSEYKNEINFNSNHNLEVFDVLNKALGN